MDRQIARSKQIKRTNEQRRQREAALHQQQRAEHHTAAVWDREHALKHLLTTRRPDLHTLRVEVAETRERDGTAIMVDLVEQILAEQPRLEGFPHGCEVGYEPEGCSLRVRYELPDLEMGAPQWVGSRYTKSTNEAKKIRRKPAERYALYREVLARSTLRALADIFDVTPPGMVDSASVDGYVAGSDPSTGQPEEFTVVSVSATRGAFDGVVLTNPELNPERCLRRFNAKVSPHPEDLMPVRSVMPWFDPTRHKVIDSADVVTNTDDRVDLLAMHPREFEELIRDLFAAMKFTAWRTKDSHDEGIDVHATVEEEITGLECIIQAKLYSRIVAPHYVRALHGSLTDRNVHKGFLVTTAWFSPKTHAYAERNRIVLIPGRRLKQLLHHHLGLDGVIPLNKLPPGWEPHDII